MTETDTGPLLDRCGACGRAQLAGRYACGNCGAFTFDQVTSDGRASVMAAVEVAQGPVPSPVGQSQFTLIMARLDEAPKVRVMAAGRKASAIGDKVRITATDGHAPYVFETD